MGLVFEDAEGKGDALPLAACCLYVQEHQLHQYNCWKFSARAGEEPFGLVGLCEAHYTYPELLAGISLPGKPWLEQHFTTF